MPYCNYCEQLDPDANRRHFATVKNLKLHVLQAHRGAPTLYHVPQRAQQPAHVKRRRLQRPSEANEQLEMAEQLAAFKQLEASELCEAMEQLQAKEDEEEAELQHMMDSMEEFEQVNSLVATGDDGYGETVYNGVDNPFQIYEGDHNIRYEFRCVPVPIATMNPYRPKGTLSPLAADVALHAFKF
ncbi:hypothetical protein, partial, partial [Absidia glauca]